MLPKHDRLASRSWVSSAACRAPARIRLTTPRTDTTTWRTALAGAAALCKFGGYDTSMRWVSGDDDSGATWSAPVSEPSSTARGASDYGGFLCASHAENRSGKFLRRMVIPSWALFAKERRCGHLDTMPLGSTNYWRERGGSAIAPLEGVQRRSRSTSGLVGANQAPRAPFDRSRARRFLRAFSAFSFSCADCAAAMPQPLGPVSGSPPRANGSTTAPTASSSRRDFYVPRSQIRPTA